MRRGAGRRHAAFGARAAVALWGMCAASRAFGGVALPSGFADSVVVRGLDFPVALAFAPDGRLFVAEQKTSAIRCIAPASGASAVVADSLPDTNASGAEGGLLGLAVDPRWPASPYLYTFATVRGAKMRIARYAVGGALVDASSPALRLDVASRRDVLDALRDSLPNHNGGTLRFGPDGMLYASVGDDEDPCSAQDPRTLRGAVLRLDVSRLGDGPGAAPSFESLRPADTPPTADPRAALVWAQGFRNPFRVQIDPLTGVAFVGDVGESEVEEIDRVAARGFNGAWPLREGPRVTRVGCTLRNYVLSLPAYFYDRVGYTAAVVCAGVARAPLVPAAGAFPRSYDGVVFALDYYQGFVRALRADRGVYAPWNVPGMADSSAGDWARGYESVADALFGPDGALWYCRQATPRFTPHTGEVGRIAWTGEVNPAPARAFGLRALTGIRADGTLLVSFTLPRAARARVQVLDASGRLLRTLADGPLAAGAHVLPWDRRGTGGRRAARGVVVVRVEAEGVAVSARAVLP